MGGSMSVDLDSMSDEQLAGLIDDASELLAKRQSRAAVDRQVADVLRNARAEGVTDTPEPGEEWVQPVGAHDAYLAGDVVSHGGKLWASTVNYNVWEPGVSGWREQAGEDEDGNPIIPEYLPPTGGHDVYMTGDLVMFEGDVYEAVMDNVTWSPYEHPPAWREVDD